MRAPAGHPVQCTDPPPPPPASSPLPQDDVEDLQQRTTTMENTTLPRVQQRLAMLEGHVTVLRQETEDLAAAAAAAAAAAPPPPAAAPGPARVHTSEYVVRLAAGEPLRRLDDLALTELEALYWAFHGRLPTRLSSMLPEYARPGSLGAGVPHAERVPHVPGRRRTRKLAWRAFVGFLNRVRAAEGMVAVAV